MRAVADTGLMVAFLNVSDLDDPDQTLLQEKEVDMSEAIDALDSEAVDGSAFSFALLFANADEFNAEIGRLFGSAFLIIIAILMFVYWVTPRGRMTRGPVAAASRRRHGPHHGGDPDVDRVDERRRRAAGTQVPRRHRQLQRDPPDHPDPADRSGRRLRHPHDVALSRRARRGQVRDRLGRGAPPSPSASRSSWPPSPPRSGSSPTSPTRSPPSPTSVSWRRSASRPRSCSC